MRRLIVCCDGTWNIADWQGGTATNVIRIARAINPAAPAPDGGQIPQIVYYHPGVGTGNRADRLLGGGFGLGLSQNVRDAYAFLVNNYMPGDEIFLFGFSRGAYTARLLGGLIGTIGLLGRSEMGGFMDAWAYYRLGPAERPAHQTAFDAAFAGRHATVPIRCIAVWDTVSAIGLPRNRVTPSKFHPCKSQYRFYNDQLGVHVDYAFQALAIDEHRRPFEAIVWHQSPDAPPTQRLKQMWFAGVHADIGGGYRDHGAGDAALLWIASELVANGLLDLDVGCLAQQFDRTYAYGAGELHKSLGMVYRIFTGRVNRRIAAGPTEYLHETVARRVQAGGYRSAEFLARHAGRIAPLNPLEAQLSAYIPARLTQRQPFLHDRRTFCDWLVQKLLGY